LPRQLPVDRVGAFARLSLASRACCSVASCIAALTARGQVFTVGGAGLRVAAKLGGNGFIDHESLQSYFDRSVICAKICSLVHWSRPLGDFVVQATDRRRSNFNGRKLTHTFSLLRPSRQEHDIHLQTGNRSTKGSRRNEKARGDARLLFLGRTISGIMGPYPFVNFGK